jgi:hypothetical protein
MLTTFACHASDNEGRIGHPVLPIAMALSDSTLASIPRCIGWPIHAGKRVQYVPKKGFFCGENPRKSSTNKFTKRAAFPKDFRGFGFVKSAVKSGSFLGFLCPYARARENELPSILLRKISTRTGCARATAYPEHARHLRLPRFS